MSKLLLIDGHSIIHRAFYGIPDLTNGEGLHTNGIYGFLNILFKILDEEKPTHLVVAFDVHEPTFRHKIFPEYKGTRKPTPDFLREQIPVLKELLISMGVCIKEKGGYEADDILGTMAKKSEAEGMEVVLVSGDRDLLQIASDKIKIRIPKTIGGKTTVEDYYADDVYKKLGVTPLKFIELKALMGDTADNIPGVPGVGPKTATDLLVTYGSLDSIYEHVDEIKSKALREKLINNKDKAMLSLTLATINVESPIDTSLENAVIPNFFNDNSYPIFNRLGFKAFLDKFESKPQDDSINKICSNVKYISLKKDFDAVVEKALNNGEVGIYIFSSDKNDKFEENNGQLSFFEVANDSDENNKTLIAICLNDEDIYFVGKEIRISLLQSGIKRIAESNVMISTNDVKALYGFIGIEGKKASDASQSFFAVDIAGYLINPLKSEPTLIGMARDFLNLYIDEPSFKIDKESIADIYKDKKDELVTFAGLMAYLCLALKVELVQLLETTQMNDLFFNIEMPTSYVLYQMEHNGVVVKKEELKEFGEELKTSVSILENKIYEDAGEEFNINSPKQLGELLFEKMKIPGGKKTKTGYSTGADVLEKLAADYPFVKNILEYRVLAKLKSTYADGLSQFIEDDGRIHCRFNQTVTNTGRLSSSEPNLQNIPTRYELGRRIRKVFTANDGCVLCDADYSQIELRLLASLSGDEDLINAYKDGKDIHTITAAKVFGVDVNDVTPTMRSNAKAVNFGIVYGISSFGLSQDLSISREDAKKYIDSYFETYPGIKEYLEKVKVSAKENGYSVTYFGRRRPIPELNNSNFMTRQFGERVAMNAPIQGTAADVMKIAMIKVFDRIVSEGLNAKLILQVHDELVVEAPMCEHDKVMNILKEEMEGAAQFPVELIVSAQSGISWFDAK